MKRILTILLAMAMALSCLPVAAFATVAEEENLTLAPAEVQNEEKPQTRLGGSWDSTISWSIEGSMLTLTGSGPMYLKPLAYTHPWDAYADSITAIEIGEGITTIHSGNFRKLEKVKSIKLPASMTSIGFGGLISLYWLETCSVAAGNPSFCAVDGVLFSKDMTILYSYPAGNSRTHYDIPEGVTTFVDGASFYECNNLQSLTFPKSFTTFEGDFYCCENLREITFKGHPPRFRENGSLFYGVTATVYYPADDPLWTADVMQDYGGDLTWVAGIPSGGDSGDTPTPPSEEEKPADYHNTLASLTEVDYAAFAQVAYENFNVGETVQQCLVRQSGNKWDNIWGNDNITYGELCEGIAQWKAAFIRQNGNTGFYAVAFQNDAGEVILAYRGSEDITKLLESSDAQHDWLDNDFPMIVFNKVVDNHQLSDAFAAYESVQNSLNPTGICLTGHSLGGGLGTVVAARYGCNANTVNAIPILDVLYCTYPDLMGENFAGVDTWQFTDHSNVQDVLAGMNEVYTAAFGFGAKLKPYIIYASGTTDIIASHSIKSIISRSGDGLTVNKKVGSWRSSKALSNKLPFADRYLDIGVSGNDYFDKGLSLAEKRTAFGGSGSDKIYTSIWADTLLGGSDWDILDGGWGNDTYYYFKGDGCDTIYDIGGQDKLYLEGFSDSDLIEMYEDADSEYISILYNGSTIVNIYKKNREYSLATINSFKVYINGGRENNITEYFNKNRSGSRLLIACPVSIEVLDAEGNVVYILTDGEVGAYYTDYGNFYIYEEEEGGYGKVLDLAEGYTVRIVGEDTGTMAIDSRTVTDGALDEPKRFADVPVTEQFTATLEDTRDGQQILAADTDGDNIVDTKLGYDGKPVPVESVTLSQEYILLQPQQTAQLQAEVKPFELTQFLQWRIEEGGKEIIAVEPDGTVTGLRTGTAYVLAIIKNGDVSETVRCRVDVAKAHTDEDGQTSVIDGIQLSATKVTTQLFSTDYAGLEILLQLPQNYTQEETPARRNRKTGAAIEKAWFTDETVSNLFDLAVLDDRRVLVIPKDEAVDHPELVKEKYISTITVLVQGQEKVSESLTLTVKKSKPELKASVKSFNSFFAGQSQQINITGATPVSIDVNEEKGTLPAWLTLQDGVLTLTADAPREDVSKKIYIKVQTEEWRRPVALSVTVKNDYSSRKLKLSSTSVTMTALWENASGVSLKLKCKNKGDTLEKLKVTDITAPDGYSVETFNSQTGSFILKPKEGFVPGTVTLQVHFEDTQTTVPLSLTVTTSKVTLKVSSKTLTLNQQTGDSVSVKLTATPADHQIFQPEVRIVDADGVDKTKAGELETWYEDGRLYVSTTATTPKNAQYKLYVSADGSKEVAITVKTIAKKASVSFAAKGSIDLSFPEQTAKIVPTFKNYSGSIGKFTYTVAEKQGKKVEDVSQHFSVTTDGKNFYVDCLDETAVSTARTYAVKLTLKLDNEDPVENTVNLKVVRTSVKLKLSKTKLSLNKQMADAGTVAVTCTTKGYAFGEPVWELKDEKGKKSAEGQLDIGYADGVLTVAVNDQTAYGTTYKLILRANEHAPSVTLTVTIPSMKKSAVTANLKVSGKLDVIRDGSSVTVTLAYKNCINTAGREETLLIYSSADGYKDPVNHLFKITDNEDGSYTITRAKDAALDHGKKYKIKLVNGIDNANAEADIKVTMGSAKLTMQSQNTKLFAKDKLDRALIRFQTKDAALNEVARVEIKESKYQKLFEVIKYGDGQFAIGYKDEAVNKSLIGETVTVKLNVFLDGNCSSKANATVSVKLTIVK